MTEKLAKKTDTEKDVTYTNRIGNKTVIVCMLLFALIFIITIFTTKRSYIDMGNVKIPTQSINGVLSVFQVAIMVYITSVEKKNGFMISLSVLVAYIVYLMAKMIRTQSIDILPGMATLIFGVFMVYVVYKNMSQIASSEEALYKLAYNDSLTGLPNRRAFDDCITDLVNSPRTKKFALAVIDLDNFKGINDSIGHECGDGVLCEVAKRWKGILKEDEFIARQGGDEFIIILVNCDDEEYIKNRMAEFLDVLSTEMVIMNNCFFASASFGIACYPFHASDTENLFRYADMAMYQAKISKTDKIRLFDISMVAPVENEYMYDRLIRSSLQNDSFEVMFQPQFKASTHELRGFEALLRMKDDYGRYVSADKFIPYAEKSKLIFDIDRWVLNNAMKLMKQYYFLFNAEFTLSINISALHLQNESLFEDIAHALKTHNFPSKNLEIEITETSLVSSVANATMLLNKIKKLGIKVALDDFGTGYASLSNLSDLPIDLLKIDKVFMDKMLMDAKNKNFVSAIISMGHIFNFEVIAEGVEYEIQLDVLKNLGCDYIQGFLWGRPLPVDVVDKFLRELYKEREIAL
ncbi:MAG: bifunctional diguanylate cyclase/phosphodiesterase [Oscillospiraceae bacterium]|nr:bifunctional diguanylate cyclase/phosphodiesterase [Oscillospiraceae bacterium]